MSTPNAAASRARLPDTAAAISNFSEPTLLNSLAFAEDSILAINPIIYAEVSIGFERIEALESALPDRDFRRLSLPFEAAFLAGKAFLGYRWRGGPRQTPLPDFYIGAHAAVSRLRLLTRDTSGFRSYFPGLELIAP